MQSETIRKLRLNIKQDFDFDIEIDHESKLIIKIKALLGMFARFSLGKERYVRLNEWKIRRSVC